jgi:hypothetical protein
MGALKWIFVIGIVVALVWLFFMPTGTLVGEELYDVEVSATVSHGILSLPQSFDISSVSYEVTGVSRNIDTSQLFGIGEFSGSFEFCIDQGSENEKCQWNDEQFSQFTLGESKTSTEVISHVSKGSHTLTVNFYTENTLRDSHTEGITI